MTNSGALQATFSELQEKYMVTTMGGGSDWRPDIKAYLANPSQHRKPGDFYESAEELADAIFPTTVQGLVFNENNEVGKHIYTLDHKLTNSVNMKELDSRAGIATLKDWEIEVLSSIPDSTNANVALQTLRTEWKEYKDSGGDSSKLKYLDIHGNYMPSLQVDPASGQQGWIGMDRGQVNALGLNDYIADDATVRLGYNINTNNLVISTQPQLISSRYRIAPDPVDDPEGFYEYIKGIPFFGNLAEILLGEEIDITDALWLVPGLGLVKLGAKAVGTTIAMRGANTVLKSKKAQPIIDKLIQMRGKGKWFGFKNEKAFNNWVNGLDPFRQAVIKSMSSTGKSIDKKLFQTNFAEIKGLQIAGKIPHPLEGTSKWIRYGIPVTGQAYEQGYLDEVIDAAGFREDEGKLDYNSYSRIKTIPYAPGF